jgi:hypothetical protein
MPLIVWEDPVTQISVVTQIIKRVFVSIEDFLLPSVSNEKLTVGSSTGDTMKLHSVSNEKMENGNS